MLKKVLFLCTGNSWRSQMAEGFVNHLYPNFIEAKSVGVEPSGLNNMPIQPKGAAGIKGRIEIFSEYKNGIKDLEEFDRIWLLYSFNRSRTEDLVVTPFLDNMERGIFATRAPSRSNHIGMSCVRLNAINGTVIDIEEVDIMNETPLLDIKPYVPQFDVYEAAKTGWLGKKCSAEMKSDKRFIK